MSKWKNKFNWSKIKEEIEKEKKTKGGDSRFFKPNWKMAIEKGKFYTLRFLPDPEGTPYAHYFTHFFEYTDVDGNKKKTYSNNCISTFGWDPKCPICEKNSEYYDSPYESDKEIAKQRQRKQNWVSNILVVNDPFEPENNGKVFLFRYGYSIFEKINKQMFPQPADLEDDDFVEFMPFDLFEGADFKLKIKAQGDWPNYDNSSFSKQKPVANGDDDEIDKIMEQVHNLSEFTDPNKFPTVEETIKQVGHLLGVTPNVQDESNDSSDDDEDDDINDHSDIVREVVEEKIKPKKKEPEPEETNDSSEDDDEDDDEAFFNSL